MKINEIEILGHGMQLKEILLNNNNITQLSKLLNREESSIRKYLNSMIINNSKFIEDIEKLLGKSWGELITPVGKQVEKYIMEVRKTIKYYTEKEDTKLITELYNLSEKYTDQYHQLIAKGNLALFRFNIGLTWDALTYIDEIIKSCEKLKYNDIALYYTVQKSYILMYADIKESRRLMENSEYLIDDQTPSYVLYSYYYYFGVLLNRQGLLRQARVNFEKAEEYAMDYNQKSKVMYNIALTFYKAESYKNALKWNRKALDQSQLSGNIDLICTIHNNMAYVFIKMGEADRARWQIEQAMERFEEINELYRKLSIYSTYLELSNKEGEELLADVLKLTQYTPNTESKPYLEECYRVTFNKFKEKKDYVTMKKLFKSLIEYSNVEGESNPHGELTSVIGEVSIYLYNKGELILW